MSHRRNDRAGDEAPGGKTIHAGDMQRTKRDLLRRDFTL
jgi:hypothetical protein